MIYQNGIVAFLTVCLLYSAFAQDPAKCKGVNITISDDRMMDLKDCLNSTGAPTINDIPKEQMGCFMKCIMSKQGLVDETGMVKKDNISASIAPGIPDDVKTSLTTQIGQCFEQAGSKLDMDDPKCASFSPLCDCVRTAYTTNCN